MKIKPLLLLSLLVLSSCTHKLEITNLNENRVLPSPPLQGSKTIGISSEDSSYQGQQYLKAIANSLRSSGKFDQVIFPYNTYVGKKVDYVANIAVNADYSGRTSNFFVNWPGFLIFMPAIIGYGYDAKITTDINILNQKTGKSYTTTLINHYKFRQAEMDRTWTEIGWLEVSIIPFIGGFFFTKYDPDVTEEFISKASDNYGSVITGGIIEAVSAQE